jgi:hypothetical protein
MRGAPVVRSFIRAVAVLVSSSAFVAARLAASSSIPESTEIGTLIMEPPDQRVTAWREDLAALVDGIAARHKNAFHLVSRESFEAAADDLETRLSDLADHQIIVGFMQLAAMIGDGHTRVRHDGASPPFRVYPVGLAWFSDGLFIVSAIDEHADLIGCELARVGATPAEEAARRVASAFPHENEASLKHTAPRFLTIAEVVQAVGLAESADQVTWTVRAADGAEREAELRAMPPGEARSRLAPALPGAPLPLARQTRSHVNWFEFLPEPGALYACYGSCANEQGQSVAEYSKAVLDAIDAHKPNKVIVDLRRNGGGDSSLLQPLVKGLDRREEIDQHGRLFVLIGRGTFSSAQMNARDLQRSTTAILIGEPTGQRPNAFGEVRTFKLPRSGLEVQYSTKRFITDPADPPSMLPDVLVELSSKDFFSGRDPVLDAALSDVKPDAE